MLRNGTRVCSEAYPEVRRKVSNAVSVTLNHVAQEERGPILSRTDTSNRTIGDGLIVEDDLYRSPDGYRRH